MRPPPRPLDVDVKIGRDDPLLLGQVIDRHEGDFGDGRAPGRDEEDPLAGRRIDVAPGPVVERHFPVWVSPPEIQQPLNRFRR